MFKVQVRQSPKHAWKDLPMANRYNSQEEAYQTACNLDQDGMFFPSTTRIQHLVNGEWI